MFGQGVVKGSAKSYGHCSGIRISVGFGYYPGKGLGTGISGGSGTGIVVRLGNGTAVALGTHD